MTVFGAAFIAVQSPAMLLAMVMAVAALAAVVMLIASVISTSRTAPLPVLRRVATLRGKSWRVAFLRQRDPDSAGHSRPRAPSAATCYSVNRAVASS